MTDCNATLDPPQAVADGIADALEAAARVRRARGDDQ